MLRDARCRYAAARAALRANTGAGTHLLRRQSRESKNRFSRRGKNQEAWLAH